MTINKKTNGSTLTISVEGRLDTITAPELEAVIKDSVSDITDLVLDLNELEYISSAGLRVLLAGQRLMNAKKGTMTVTNCSENITEIFEITGFADILTIK